MARKVLLLELLESLSSKQLEQLIKFSESDYWKLKSEDKVFLKALIFSELGERELLYERQLATFERDFKYQKTRILQMLENFIFLELSNQSNLNKEIILARYYSDKGLQKNYQSKIKNVQKQLDKEPLDANFGLLKFGLYEILASQAKTLRKEVPELELMLRSLNQFFAENSARLLCEFANQKEIINASYQAFGLESILDRLPNTPVSTIYRDIYLLNTSDSPISAYDSLKQIIFDREISLSPNLIKTIHIHLMNHCLRQINRADANFAAEYVLLGESLIEQKLFLENGQIEPSRFKNMITTSLLIAKNDFSFTEKFIQKYAPLLPSQHAENIKGLNLANIFFHKGNYSKALEILRDLPSGEFDLYYKIMYKKLYLKLLYQLRQNIVFHDYLKNFRTFINKQKELKGSKKLDALKFFAKSIGRLSKGKLNYADLDLGTLALTDSHWFQSKLKKKNA